MRLGDTTRGTDMRARPITLTVEERAGLESLTRRHSAPQQVVTRARIVLAAGDTRSIIGTADDLGLNRDTVRLWRDRWTALQDIPLADLDVAGRLTDAPRPGAPARITAEQVCQVIALACEAPTTAGRPISQWTNQELADEITKRGIVDTISPRHAARVVKRGILNPIWSAIGSRRATIQPSTTRWRTSAPSIKKRRSARRGENAS